MYPISDYVYDLYIKQYRQVVDITMQTKDETLRITDADILQNNFTIDRYCMSGKRLEIGSAVAAELKMKLNNRDGRFDNVTFEGAELFVRVGIYKWDAHRWENAQVEYVPCGYFTIDEPPRKLTSISISALDRMVQFDKDSDKSAITFPTTIGQLLMKCCEKCNVPLHTQMTDLLFSAYTVNKCPDAENLTYRQIIQWIGEISGTCAYIDWDGKLRLEWYHETPTVIDGSVRYTSDLMENDVELTGVRVVDSEKKVYLSGSDAYALNIEGNELIQHDHQIVAASLHDKVNGLKYRPYTCTVRSMPHVYPLDKISYIDKDGMSHSTIVTHYTFKLNGRTALSGKGETATKSGYASMNPLTKRESAIIAAMKKEVDSKIASREQSLLQLNETISNSLGLRMTAVEQDNGSIVYYYHNGETLEDSNIIYTFREGGFAWTDVWAGDDTVWQYGFDRYGNAVYNALSTYKIQTEYLDAGCVTTEKLSVEFKQSIFSLVSDAETRVTQSFRAADGELSSLITEEIARSQAADETHSTHIWQNAEAIEAEVTRASGAESVLSSSITMQANKIALVVQESSTGSIINAASIVAAVNAAGSSVRISANKIYLAGQTIASAITAGDIIAGALLVQSSAKDYPLIKANAKTSELQIGGFNIFNSSSYGYIARGKLNYADAMDGVFIGTNGIGLGKGTFYVTNAGKLHAADAEITGSTFTGTLKAGTVLVNGIELGYWTNPSVSGYGLSKTAASGYSEVLLMADNGIYMMKNRAGDTANGISISDSGTYIYGYAGDVSDMRAKKEIRNIDEKYSTFFDNIRPRLFKYRGGTSDRVWTGVVAQEVDAALKAAGLSTKDFAGIVIPPRTVRDQKWSIRYDLFIALCINEIQKLKQRMERIDRNEVG